MHIIWLAIALLTTLVSSRDVAGALPFELPTLRHLKGTIRPSAGRRLHVVTIRLGDEPMFADVRGFALLTSRGNHAAIGAGGSGDSIIPFDRIPLGQEIGQVLPSDALLALTRTSADNVVLELGPRGTVAFLYELPSASTVRAIRLPDGRELPVAP